MEDNSLNHQNGVGQVAKQGGAVSNNKENDETSVKAQYSIPGILHFIQHEWARFELERSQWEVDRAELQARIAFLQGERKGQENLKNDLVRRIKMLEYALKQERSKFHKLKYGTELQQGDMNPPPMDETSNENQIDADPTYISVTNSTWKQGRQLLRQYLQEIGYTDRIIDVRSTRVRALLGLNNNAEQEENHNGGSLNGSESNKRPSEGQVGRKPFKKERPGSLAEAMMIEAEQAVMANMEFLTNSEMEMDDDEDIINEKDVETIEEADDDVKAGRKKGKSERLCSDFDSKAMEVINEITQLFDSEDDNDDGDQGDWNQGYQTTIPKRPIDPVVSEDINNALEGTLGLGELAQLTVNNDAENTYDMATSKEAFRKTWNAKYTLRSHFDGVRALAFHPTEPVLITGSEDHTLKLWNLQKTVPAKKSASLDVEPLYTFRCHNKPVLCLAISGSGDYCYSGSLDSAIHVWNVPNSNIDPYDQFDPEILYTTLNGHTNAVWGLSVLSSKQQLLSCSADGTIKLWAPHSEVPLLNTFTSEPDGAPSSVDFIRDHPFQIVAAYNSSHSVIFDIETAKPVVRLESGQEQANAANKMINKIVSHPTLPLTITAHEDRHIRFWDNVSGKMVHSMVAHLDAVTSLAVDPNGLYLLSGSHDCSIRLWHLDNKTCVQEITAHRKKFDESILDVAFHPSKPYIASAGADGLAKVFV
ncbi:striatin-3 isoform X1 [Harmonia axyridis]|uniref:striatin-3 isoform X1 n=1 Tax=Harmonia axyridis TaxID=115357 RepID=UPI001E279C91|nr:striatin-3 isoform X1 [Harmonia axyridis]